MDVPRLAQVSSPALASPAASPLALRALPAEAGVRSPTAARDAGLDPKLVTAAHQFEASMMAELLKPLNSGGDLGGEDEDSGASGLGGLASSADGSGGALMSFSSEALAKALSDKGGLGIARRILDHFEQAKAAADAAKAGSAAAGLSGGAKP